MWIISDYEVLVGDELTTYLTNNQTIQPTQATYQANQPTKHTSQRIKCHVASAAAVGWSVDGRTCHHRCPRQGPPRVSLTRLGAPVATVEDVDSHF